MNLYEATKSNNKERVHELLTNGGIDLDTKYELNQTALMIASRLNLPEILLELLTFGADKDIRNISGDTALMLACRYGYLEIVRILLAHHADCNIQNYTGRTALIWSISLDTVEITRLLLANNANVNIQDFTGNTALMYKTNFIRVNNAIEIEMCNLLIDNGANVNIRNSLGNTALINACRSGRLEIVKKLLASGADKNIVNFDGETAYMLAQNQEIRNLLLTKIQLNPVDYAKYTNPENNCSICLNNYNIPQKPLSIVLPCNHVYHESCITTWINTRNVCPKCNGPIIRQEIIIIDQTGEVYTHPIFLGGSYYNKLQKYQNKLIQIRLLV